MDKSSSSIELMCTRVDSPMAAASTRPLTVKIIRRRTSTVRNRRLSTPSQLWPWRRGSRSCGLPSSTSMAGSSVKLRMNARITATPVNSPKL